MHLPCPKWKTSVLEHNLRDLKCCTYSSLIAQESCKLFSGNS